MNTRSGKLCSVALRASTRETDAFFFSFDAHGVTFSKLVWVGPAQNAERSSNVMTPVDAAVGDDGSDGDEQDQYHLF